MRHFLNTLRFGLMLATAALPAVATAQAYPNKPIKWIVGYPSGGAFDFLARALAQPMAVDLGQPLLVENRPGAAGIIGMEAASRSAPDGYTVAFVGSGELVFNQVFYKKLPYDPDKDFTLVGLVAKIPLVLAVNNSIDAKDIGQFIAHVKANPGKLSYASGGLGHPTHLAMELLKQRAGMDITNVAYRGMAPALQDVVAGNVPAIFIDVATGMAQLKAGKLKMLGVSTKERIERVSGVPPIAESGIPNFDVYSWVALAFPGGTSPQIVKRMNDALGKALQSPDVAKRFTDFGIDPLSGSAEQLSGLIRSDREKWHPLIRNLGISLD
jgi:tripartite-type tricarboxylate transporter receptor subunit TctC